MAKILFCSIHTVHYPEGSPCEECAAETMKRYGVIDPNLPPTWGHVNGKSFGEQSKLDQAVLDAAELWDNNQDDEVACVRLAEAVRARRGGLK